MREKAILIAAKPYESSNVGDVKKHIRHLKRYGSVVWDLIPVRRIDIPWKHPEVSTRTISSFSARRLSEGGLFPKRAARA